MKQIMRKILSGMAALAMVITMAAPGITARAEEKAHETKVILTKLKLKTLNDVTAQDTFGEEKTESDLANLFAGKEPETLDGVTFKVFEVKEAKAFKNMTENSQDFKTEAAITDAGGTLVKTAKTQNGGKIEMNLPDGNYWVIEMPNKDVVDALAVPFGMSLPMTNKDGTAVMDTVYVYPKNVTTEKPVPEKNVVSLNNFAGSVNVGEDTDFFLISSIPNGIDKYDVFTMRDDLKEAPCHGALAFTDAQVKVVLLNKTNGKFADATVEKGEALTKDDDYTLTVDNDAQTISVSLTKAGREKMQAFHDTHKEPQIVVNFKAHPTKEAIKPGEALNSYTVSYHHKGTVDGEGNPTDKEEKETSNKVKLVLSGKNFAKMKKGEDVRLKGAEFIMSRTAEGKVAYLSKTSTDDKAVWTTKKEDAKVFKTNENGETAVSGLAYTKTVTQTDKDSETVTVVEDDKKYAYAFIETKAPKGYALLQDPIPFTINAGSRTETDGIAVQTETIKDVNPDDASAMRIDNTKLTIPQTGGMGALIFAVAGVLIMGAAYAGLKKED